MSSQSTIPQLYVIHAKIAFQYQLIIVGMPNFFVVLAQRGYFKEREFINYLDYLQYWKKQEYAQYLK